MRALRGLRSGAVRCKARPPCKQRSGERARLQIGRAEHGELLTQNMLTMLVTRDVSKLSGWLNEYAPCRACRMEGLNGAGGAYVAGRGKRGRAANTGRSGGGGGCGARRREARGGRSAVHTQRAQGEGARGGAAHVKHPGHVRDAGRVEVQWLVEPLIVLPRVASRAYQRPAPCGPGGGRQDVWEEVRGEERHLEHGAHVCDARRVEAERVVETRLPRVASAVHCSGALRAGEGGRRRATAVQGRT